MIIKYMFPVLMTLLASMIFTACPKKEESEDHPFDLGDSKVAAYIRTWSIPGSAQVDGSSFWNADMIKGEYLSDLIISFALINKSDGFSLYIPEVESGRFSNLWNEVSALKQKYPKLNVTFSVGGYNEGGFSDMADDPAKRAGFTANVCDWLERHNLDGVDIDWEYPVGPPWGQHIPSRASDRENYITLLQDLRDVMDELGKKTGKRYSLSTAVPASGWFLQSNDVKAASRIVDALKLMSYDYYGSWSSTTGHNANIFRNPLDPAGWSTDQAVTAYLNAGIQSEKIMLGAAFYGRAWRGVAKGNNSNTPGLFQPYDNVPFDGLSWTDLKQDYLTPVSGYTRYWDNIAKSPFLFNDDIWITYSDEEQIKLLGAYAKEKKLKGVFTWEYAHDFTGELIKILAESSQ
ncbi:MAG: glycoside hydrolase family 18 protein [Treponema sp.]|nr:glycoside hydrolase family 18 protein [Treponema sp.]